MKSLPDNDVLLLDRFLAGDASALERVVSRHLDTVYAAARRRDEHEASDLTQATFLVLMQRARHARRAAARPGGLTPWLLTTVRFVASNLDRRQRRRRFHESTAARVTTGAAADADPSLVLAWREIVGRLDDEVLRLPNASRDVIVLRFYDGLGGDELAEKLRCSPAAARQRVSRAVAMLRDRLDSGGVQVTTATLGTLLATRLVHGAPTTLLAAATASVTPGVAGLASASFATTGKLVAVGMAASLAVVATVNLAAGEPTTQPAAVTPPATRPSAVELARQVDASPLPADGEIIERTLEDHRDTLDLDIGRVYRRDKNLDEALDLVAGFSCDVTLSYDPLAPGLQGELKVKPVVAAAFDLPPASPEVAELWEAPMTQGWTMLDAVSELPRTFLFRTRNGAGGVLQIVELLDPAEDLEITVGFEQPGVRLRYRILTRGEGDDVAERVARFVKNDGGWGGDKADEHYAVAAALRQAMQGVVQYQIDNNDQPPADLDVLREIHGDHFPDLPETTLYVPPVRDPASPREGMPVVLFEKTKAEPDEKVVVAYADGSATLVRGDELPALLERVGVKP